MPSSALYLLAVLGCGTHSTAPTATPLDETAAERPSPFAEIEAFAGTINDRGALLPAGDPWGETATRIRYLDQNWGPVETLWFYYADQGSRLIPRETLLHLERADSEAPLAAAETFLRYRYLPQVPTPNNPDGLPVGFTQDGEYIGLTCAACHTGQIIYGETAVRIDGAPSLGNMIGLFEEIQASLEATLADEAKLARFLRAVGAAGDAEAEAQARLSLERSRLFFSSYTVNFTEVPGGYGRVDAIGAILNQVLRFTSGTGSATQANAPTSYPLLWDAPRHDYLQWTAFSANAGPGSLGRNVGEVVGVFGDVHATASHSDRENDAGFASSIKAHNLVDMEETLWRLQSPVWPEDILPPIDREKAARGAQLYAETCSGCHALLDRADPKRRVTAQVLGLEQVGTDPRSALNLVDAVVPTGVLEGSLTPDGKGVYGSEAPASELIVAVGAGVLKQNKAAVLRTLANARRWDLAETPKQGDHPPDTADDPIGSWRAYKARPLNGAWASAPYLHNGSVPTLYDLLLPEAERPTQFAVGLWSYDPVKVGYVSDGEAPWVFDTTITGNHNPGHLYGTTLSDADRWALVEYLKTL